MRRPSGFSTPIAAGGACAIALLSSLAASVAGAQIRSSERGTVSQEVDGTVIALDYGRPQVRGRVLFPEVQKWGEVWTPGANWATTLEVNRPIRLEGQALKPGTYGVWFTPGEKEWTIALHKDARRFHTSPPKAAEMLLSIKKEPRIGPATEVLTFDFTEVSQGTTTLQFRWGAYTIPLRIDVEPSLKPGALTTATAAPFVGDYTMVMYGEHGDSTVEKLVVDLRNGRLHAMPTTPGLEFVFVPVPGRSDIQYIAFLQKGEITDIEVNTPARWKLKGVRAVQFTVPEVEPGKTWFKAVRK